MFWKKNNEFRLQVGSHVIGIVCPSAEYAKSFEEYFGVASAGKKSDISIALSLVDHDEDIFVPDSMFVHKKTDGVNFIFGDDLAHGSFSNAGRKGELVVKSGLTKKPVTRVFEQILYQAFYTIVKYKKSSDFLIHSSGVIYRGKAFLFVGSSGSGKSTVAKLSNEYTVLNDEICLVTNSAWKYFLHGTPFNGLFQDKIIESAPLAAVLLLAHGTENRFLDIKKSDAAKIIAKEIVPPTGLTDELSPKIFADLLDYSSDMYDTVPVKTMEFLPDRSFWQLIDREFFPIP